MFLRKDPLKRARLPKVTAGAKVFTADAKSLGTVVEVGDVSFKVDAPRKPDFWLGRDYVIEATSERVSMSFDKSDLGAYKLGQAGMEPEKDTTQESLKDAAIPKDEQIAQRVRMEQELAEQRRELPHTHPEGSEYTAPDTGGTIGEPVEEELRDHGIDPLRDAAEERGRDVEEFSETGSYVKAPTPSPEESYTGTRDWRGPATDFDYSVPTRERDYDPAKMRRPITGGAMGAVAAVSLGGLALLWLMRRRRRQRRDRLEARARDLARQAAEFARDAAKQGVDAAREGVEAVRK
jgi:hypothetical protein